MKLLIWTKHGQLAYSHAREHRKQANVHHNTSKFSDKKDLSVGKEFRKKNKNENIMYSSIFLKFNIVSALKVGVPLPTDTSTNKTILKIQCYCPPVRACSRFIQRKKFSTCSRSPLARTCFSRFAMTTFLQLFSSFKSVVSVAFPTDAQAFKGKIRWSRWKKFLIYIFIFPTRLVVRSGARLSNSVITSSHFVLAGHLAVLPLRFANVCEKSP